MTSQLSWDVARAAGVVAWLLLSAAVVWGLLISTRLLRNRPTQKWLLDLHRFMGGLAVIFVCIHLVALVADSYVTFDLVDLAVPLASQWRPEAVALGVVGFWLLLAVEITSLARAHLPRRLWRGIHGSSYVVFWLATLHGLLAGSDADHRLFAMTNNVVVAVVVFLSLVRFLDYRGGRRRPSAQVRPPRPAPTA